MKRSKKSTEKLKNHFYDDSIPDEAKLVIYSIGDFKKKETKIKKIKNYVLRKSNSLPDFKDEVFNEDLILPKDLNSMLKNSIKDVDFFAIFIFFLIIFIS